MAKKRKAMTPSNLCFRAAMLLVLAGMLWGLQMAITDDHSAFPAHAHLNLLGFVALFLFGIFYRLNRKLKLAGWPSRRFGYGLSARSS